jgi:hypothetical protein
VPCRDGWREKIGTNILGFRPPFTIRLPMPDALIKLLNIALIISMLVKGSLTYTLCVLGGLILLWLLLGLRFISIYDPAKVVDPNCNEIAQSNEHPKSSDTEPKA